MSKAACFVACCLFAMISASTLALGTVRTEVRRVPAGQMININCSLRVCDEMLKGDVVEIRLAKWRMAKQNISRLDTLMMTYPLQDKTKFDIVPGVSGANNINVTEGQQEPSLEMSTQDVETGDAYQCDILFWKDENMENISCITQLEVTASSTLPESTTGVTRGFSAHDQGASPQDQGESPQEKGASPQDQGASPQDQGASPQDQGASPLIPPTDERNMSGSVSLPMVGVGMMVVSILLLSTTLILIILIYIRLSSGDFLQQTTQLPPKPDTIEKMVANEPIYSIVKK